MASIAAAPSPTLHDWVVEWKKFSLFTLKPKTVVLYEDLFRTRILPVFGAAPIDRVDGLAVRRWVADMSAEGLSAYRIRHAHSLLRQVFRSAMECGLLDQNPCEGVRLPRIQRSERLVLAPHEVELLA